MKRDCENLFFDNFNLIYHILKKLDYNKNDQDDLVQEGAIGLLKAINNFDDKKGIRFSTYAFSCIKNEMLYYLRKNHYNYIYLNDYIYDDIELIETIESYDNNILEELIKNEMIESLKQYLNNKLNKIEQFIIKSLFGIECEKKNQGEVATILNVSQGSVSKEKKKAIKKIRDTILVS